MCAMSASRSEPVEGVDEHACLMEGQVLAGAAFLGSGERVVAGDDLGDDEFLLAVLAAEPEPGEHGVQLGQLRSADRSGLVLRRAGRLRGVVRTGRSR